MTRGILAWLAVVLVTMVSLAWNLPPHAFYAGDSGVKLIAARNVIAHPTRPLQVDLPAIGGRAVPYVERFFALHGDHAHALQAPLFPIVSAPFIAAFGLRGAYVLPLLSFLAMLPLLESTRRRVAPEISAAWLAALATLASPVFFYALEYWEHAPAIACVTAATALLLRGRPPSPLATSVPPGRDGGACLAGIAGGLAILLRPEAAWYVAVLGCVTFERRTTVAFAIGLALVVVPFALANLIEYGNVAGPHVAANLAPLTDNWWPSRLQRGALWFVPNARLAMIGLAALAAILIANRFGLDRRRAQLAALIMIAPLAIAAASGTFSRDVLWHAWPAGFLLLLPTKREPSRTALWLLIIVPIAGIWVTSTHDGGAQWGPRFVLIATPALLLSAAIACADASGPGFAQRPRQVLVIVVVLAGLWTTRAAYRELRGTKQMYAAMVDAVERHLRPGAYAVSNLWWFDQVVASLYGSRTFLYAEDVAVATTILQQLAASGIPSATLVWSRDPSEGESLTPAVTGTCYRFINVHTVVERSLSVATVACPQPNPQH